MIKAVTVYCSSSASIPQGYFVAAKHLGSAIARNGWALVYGGNYVGLMAAVADGARSAGGSVVGISPQALNDKGLSDGNCHEFIVTPGMRERKALLEHRGDAFVALPGGLGTLEELFEVIVGKQLGYHSKPIVLLNIENYYAPLLALIDHGMEQQFIKAKARNLFFVAEGVESAIQHLQNYEPPANDAAWMTPTKAGSEAPAGNPPSGIE